jgi:hypothetical protein
MCSWKQVGYRISKTLSRVTSVSTVIRYWKDDRQIVFDSRQGQEIFSPQRPDSLLPNGDRRVHPQGKCGRSVILTIFLQLMRRLKNLELYLHYTIRLHGVVLNWAHGLCFYASLIWDLTLWCFFCPFFPQMQCLSSPMTFPFHRHFYYPLSPLSV